MKSLLIGFFAAVATAHRLADGTMSQYETLNNPSSEESVQALVGIDIQEKWCIYENDGTFYNFIKLRNKDA